MCPGVPYHVTQRGNRREKVFFSDYDRQTYLDYLKQYTGQFAIDVIAYSLMGNHVHLIIVPSTQHGLQRALRPLHMRHAQRINRTRSWHGHVWQGRYFSSALDDAYLWTAIRYVELNPVRAGLTARAEDYPWSSAAAHCSLRPDPVLTTNPFWNDLLQGVGDWSAWLAAGEPTRNFQELRRHTFKGLPCGSPAFVERLERATGRQLQLRPQGRPRRPREQNIEKGLRPLFED